MKLDSVVQRAEKFWKEVQKLPDVESNTVLALPDGVKFLGHHQGICKLFVRKSYVDLHTLIHDTYKSTLAVIITGNPGIGKTYFSLYELYRLSKKQPTYDGVKYVVYTSVPLNLHFCFCFGSDECIPINDIGEVAKFLDPEAIYLFDAGYKGDGRCISPVLGARRTIVFSSPAEKNYKLFRDSLPPPHDCSMRYVTLYMPVWSWDELETWCELRKEPADQRTLIKEKFMVQGGIPRYVLEPALTTDSLKEKVSTVITTNSFNVLLNMGGNQNTDKVSHQIFHLKLDNKQVTGEGEEEDVSEEEQIDYGKASLTFASLFVREAVFREYKQKCQSHIVNKIAAKRRLFDQTDADLFELCVHSGLTKGGKFNVRCLTTQAISELTLPSLQVKHYLNTRELSKLKNETSVYLRPVPKNSETVDAIILHNGDIIGIQITLADHHEIKKNGLELVQEALGCGPDTHFKVYFVVPDTTFGDGKSYQTPQKFTGARGRVLKQYNPKNVCQSILEIKLQSQKIRSSTCSSST